MSSLEPRPLPASRRTFVQLGVLAPWFVHALQERRVQAGADGQPHFVDPPGALPAALAARLAELEAALTSGKTKANELLTDPANDALRPHTEFRALIARHAETAHASLAPRGEPGTPFLATVVVLDAGGNPYADARVYAYQTSAKGWYAAEAPHVSGNSGDSKHARLFAHGRTDAAGHLELLTVRPGPYPNSDLPSHIHLVLEGREQDLRVTEIRFEDCPRMTPAMREASERNGFVVVPVEKTANGGARCMAEFLLPG